VGKKSPAIPLESLESGKEMAEFEAAFPLLNVRLAPPIVGKARARPPKAPVTRAQLMLACD
jgi:hypothetical protein